MRFAVTAALCFWVDLEEGADQTSCAFLAAHFRIYRMHVRLNLFLLISITLHDYLLCVQTMLSKGSIAVEVRNRSLYPWPQMAQIGSDAPVLEIRFLFPSTD